MRRIYAAREDYYYLRSVSGNIIVYITNARDGLNPD
jgi:hypothetical protein